MAKYNHRLCLMVPFEMEDIFDGELLAENKAPLMKALRKYLVLFCMVTAPEDMEIVRVDEDFISASKRIFVVSNAFPKLYAGAICCSLTLSDRDGVKNFFQGLS